MIIYNPLNVIDIEAGPGIGQLLTVKAAGLVGALTIAFAQLILRPLLGVKTFTLGSFIAWVCLEMVLLSLVIFAIFKEGNTTILAEIWVTMKLTMKIAFPPYLLACVVLFVKEGRQIRSVIYDQSSSTSIPSKGGSTDYLSFRDENGKEQLILNSSHLIYIEAENNYIDIVYLEGNKIKKKLIRTTLKSLEHELSNSTLLRVHRSYIINLDNISNVERTGSKIVVSMNHIKDVVIPVSTSHRASLERAIIRV